MWQGLHLNPGPGDAPPLRGAGAVSSTEAPARGPGHCITQVALSDPGSPAPPPPRTPSSPAPMLGMMKPQLLEWRGERARGRARGTDHLEDPRQAHCGLLPSEEDGGHRTSGLGIGGIPGGLQELQRSCLRDRLRVGSRKCGECPGLPSTPPQNLCPPVRWSEWTQRSQGFC